MLPGALQSVLLIHASKMLSIVERAVKSVHRLPVNHLDGENLGLANSPLIRPLPALIGMEHNRIYSDPAVANSLNFNFNLIDIGICPIQSFHSFVLQELTQKQS